MKPVQEVAKPVAGDGIGIGNAAAGIEDDIRPEATRVGDKERQDGGDRRHGQRDQAGDDLAAGVLGAPADQEHEEQKRHRHPRKRFQGDGDPKGARGEDRMAAREQGEGQQHDREKLDVGAARPQVERDHRAGVDGRDQQEAALRTDGQRDDRDQSDDAKGHQDEAIVEGNAECVGQEAERNAGENRERVVSQVMQSGVGAGCQVPAERGHRGVGPVHAVDRLPLEQAVNCGLQLEQPVVLHRQADVRALQDADQRRTHGGQQAQQRDAPQLQPPETRARPEQQQEGKQCGGTGDREPDAIAPAQHPEQHDL